MLQAKTPFRYANLVGGRWHVPTTLVLGLSTLLVWAAVAYSAVGWVLRDNPAAEVATSVAGAATPQDIDPSAVARVLGAQPQAPAPTPTLASRLQLVGVLNGDPSTGVALISVDGKPAKPFRVGKPVIDGWVLQSTQAKQAHLGPSVEGPTGLSLDLPVKK